MINQTVVVRQSWYKQFWPWFLILLPASAVVASIITIMLAANNADSLVVDDYYKKALNINRDLKKLEFARQQGLSADLELKGNQLILMLRLKNKELKIPPTLKLLFIHPANSEKDFSVTMVQPSTEYQYSSTIDSDIQQKMKQNNWYLQLLSPDKTWRLNGEFEKNNKNISLTAS